MSYKSSTAILCLLGTAKLASSFAPPARQVVKPDSGYRLEDVKIKHLQKSSSESNFYSIKMSTTDELGGGTTGTVLDDVDGIGELTNIEISPVPMETDILTADNILADTIVETLVQSSTTESLTITGDDLIVFPPTNASLESVNVEPSVETPVNNDDILSSVDESKLLDPTAVVEAVIGTALSDPDANGSIPTPNLRQEAIKDAIATEAAITAPSIQKIIKFAIPAVGVWLCSPLLSLIDTSSVGLLSGTTQQAALNPAVAVTDYGALLVAFMYTATTNLIASAREVDVNEDGSSRTKKTLVTALQLSGFVGGALGLMLTLFTRTLLKSIIGNDSLDPEVFAAAMRYVRIRSLGMPAAVIIGSAQSACLGMQDIRSPLYVLLAAAIVNLAGDMLFVGNSNVWIGGAAGAAWATVFSQYAAMGMFLKWLTSKSRRAAEKEKAQTINLTDAILELTSKSDEGKSRRKNFRKALRGISSSVEPSTSIKIPNRLRPVVTKLKPIKNLFSKRKSPQVKDGEESFSSRGFLAGNFRRRDILKFPKLEAAKEFWPYVLPVTTTSVGRVSSYVAMSHVVSSSLGTLGMAANQIIVSFFYCLTPVADSLNLTAQSFIPGIFEKKPSKARTLALQQGRRNFIRAGLVFGGAMAAAVGTMPLLGKFFTSDQLVMSQVNAVAPLLVGVFSMHGVICAIEGLLLGQKDLNFLGKAYAGFFAAVPYFMLKVKKAALTGTKSINLNSVWEVFLCYQFVRVSTWLFRSSQLQRKAELQTDYDM